MNLTAVDPTQPPPYPPPQPPRSSFSCDRHPVEQFSGFCPECLCERLTILDQAAGNNPSSSSRRPSTSSSAAAAAALRAVFSKPSSATNSFHHPHPKSSKPSSFFHELRRTKSFSAAKNEALNFSGASFEPQRKSCDVRGRNTLWTLFSLENEINPSCSQNPCPKEICESEEEENKEPTNSQDSIEHCINEGEVIEEITVLPVQELENEPGRVANLEALEECFAREDMLKPMKDHLNLDSQAKKPSGGGMDLKEIAGNFWSSVFSKKWQKWRRKQKLKKQNNGRNSSTLPAEKCTSKQYRDTQSEIADYGFGRRSCDTDPRFSLDAGRISFDDPRYSFDEPRASWDGYLIGRSFHRMAPMVSLEEDARSDTKIPLEEPSAAINGENRTLPGGSAQTREYYTDSSSSRRRKSLDRSSSTRKTATFVGEVDDMKIMLPDYLVGMKDSTSNSNCSETFELPGFRDNASVIGNGETKNLKKSKRWAWNILGFIHRRGGGNKDEDVFHRNYSNKIGTAKKSCSVETKKRRDDIVLERNRSARFSPNHDNGLLRFYLTPMIGSRRGMPGKYRPNGSHPIAARSILRLY